MIVVNEGKSMQIVYRWQTSTLNTNFRVIYSSFRAKKHNNSKKYE